MDEVDRRDVGAARAEDLLSHWRSLPVIDAALLRSDLDEALDSAL